MCPQANRTPIRDPSVAAVFSARRIEYEFDERDELMQRLILGSLPGV
jgi:hypothetical protein